MLIETQLDCIAQVGEHLQSLSQQLHALYVDPPGFAELTARWQFTATQQHQLRGLLARWQVLAPDRPLGDDLLALRDRAEVLGYIERRLGGLKIALANE